MKSSYSYSSTSFKEAHIKGLQQFLGIHSILGGSTHDSRADKGTGGYNASLKLVVESINQYGGSNGKKGFLFSDCDLTAHDMNYLSAKMINSNHNFAIVDFSDNPQLGALGLDYLIKGQSGISSLQSGNHDINLMYQGILTRANFNFDKLDLSGCNIGDVGADILSHVLFTKKLPSLKNLDISGNNISTPKITQLLNQASQDIFVVTEKSYEEGKAVYKDTSGKLYDMHIKSDGKDAVIEFADGITGISGVSAGDTCPPTVRSQIGACIGGASAAAVGGVMLCSGEKGKTGKIVCVAKSAYAGCASAVAGSVSTQCTTGHEYKDGDKGDFGFTVDGGTEIKGTYIDNDNGLPGSNFDLSQHDFS